MPRTGASMIETRAEIDIASTPERAWAVLWEVERYPEFLSDFNETQVLSRADSLTQVVAFEMRLFRLRTFRLELRGEPPFHVSWSLVDGANLRHNHGDWTIEALNDQIVRLHYRLEIDIDIPVPDAIARRLMDFNLPTAMRQFKARIEMPGASRE